MEINIAPDSATLGERAACFVANKVKDLVSTSGDDYVRVIVATGASQFDFIASLVAKEGLPWDRVEFFHLDEYVGLDDSHPSSFRKYLNDRLFSQLKPQPARVHLLDPNDVEGYAALLGERAIDLACIGIGENSHLAFNDPGLCDFNDPELVKVVALDDACRRQQVGEGWFQSIEEVPTHAVTLTIPAIMRCKTISCVVPDERKARAVYGALRGNVGTDCPATCLRTHSDVKMWLDEPSASLLSNDA